MNILSPDNAIRMVQTVNNMHDIVGQFVNSCGLQPSPKSQAASELNMFQRPESLTTAYSQGTILIEAAADQLMAFTKTVTQPVQTVAPWSCLRCFIESCALAMWLLDPNIEAKTRVQRSFAFRYEGLVEEAKFLVAVGDKPTRIKINTRIDEVERVALELGFPRVEDKNGERIGIAQNMPSITEIIIKNLDEEAVYRLLSAMTHAHHWALQQLSFRGIGGNNSLKIEDAGENEEIHLFEKHLEPFYVAFLCGKAAKVFSKPVMYQCELFGWDVKRLKSIFALTFTNLGMK